MSFLKRGLSRALAEGRSAQGKKEQDARESTVEQDHPSKEKVSR